MVRLLAVLVLAGGSVNAQTYTSGDWQYIVENGQATITGYTGSGGVVTIPSDFSGVPVRTVGSGWPPILGSPNTSVTSIIISNGVTSIGNYAFWNSQGLISVTIPNSMTVIGTGAFAGCTSLTSITIPNSVTQIGDSAFYLCTSLNSIYFPPQFSDDEFTTFGLTSEQSTKVIIATTPADFNNLMSSSESTGIAKVTNDPNSYNLYTTNQIHNLGLGGIVLSRDTNNQLVLNYQVLQSSDLQSWSPYQQTELVISNAPSDKMFLRVQAVGQ